MALLDVVIDVSHGQGDIDWRSVAEAGIKVAMVKATEGHTFTDSAWHANLRGATQAGIKVIPYHFLRAGAAEDQAAHFRDVVGLKHGMAYALDWEGTRTAAAADVEQMGRILAEITRRNPVGYWGMPGNTPETPTAAMERWERWVPRYPLRGIANFPAMPLAHHLTGVEYRFWQYTSHGKVSGIHGDVDRSVASFDDPDHLIRWCS
jgi:lysozyme